MARGKGKYGPKSKILVVLKSAHHKFLENALSKLIFSKVENGTPCRAHLTLVQNGKFSAKTVFDDRMPMYMISACHQTS